MLKKPSFGHGHSDLYPVGREQLFAELTPAEAAFIEGGAILCLDLITYYPANQTRLVVDGMEVWCGKVVPGEKRCIEFDNSVTIELVDSCYI